MKKNEQTFDVREERLIRAALKAEEFSLPVPAGLAERVAARAREAAVPHRAIPRWLKIAASFAAIASFAAFAATMAVRLASQEEEKPAENQSAPEGEKSAETFEEIFSEELKELKQQEEKAMNSKTIKRLATGSIAAATALMLPSAQGAVRGSVFDDAKVWYKGSAGNAVGTKDADSNAGGASKIKNLPNLAGGNAHGGTYGYWAWRMNYVNEKVDCPYAGVTLDSTPCMVVPEFTSSKEDVAMTIGGVNVTRTVWKGRRFGNLYFTNWMSDWSSSSVCSNWTCVLRFRSDRVNAVGGNCNKIIDIGSLYDGTAGKATGVNFLLNTPDPGANGVLADYASPRTFVTTTQKNYTDIKIKNNRWVDCALAVNGRTLTMWFCWNDGTDAAPTNRLAKVSETYPTTAGLPTIAGGCRVNLASTINGAYNSTYTNGVYNSTLANKGFQGAFHQIAFWDRTLSDNEIRQAMAAGTGRPNLVQVGIEGNGIGEFATSDNTASVSNTGAWENLNPTLTASNPSATIAFDCPALWAGLPQHLRIPMASTSSSGTVEIRINGTSLGTAYVGAGKTACVYVKDGIIASGSNTLVIERVSGNSLVLDAVTLGGSWRFGETISSFASTDEGNSLTDDKYLFNPANGNDKLHARGLNGGNGNHTYFDFFVPENLVGKFRGVFATRAQNTGGVEKNFSFYSNGESLGDYKLKGDVVTEVKIPETAIVAGWNRLSWMSHSGGDWANIDWHKFTVLPPPKGLLVIIK